MSFENIGVSSLISPSRGSPSTIELPREQIHMATCNMPVRSGFSEPLPLAVHHGLCELDAIEEAKHQQQLYKKQEDEKVRKLAEFQTQVRERIRAMKLRERADKLNRTLQLQESENLLMKSVDPVRKPPVLSSPLIAVNCKVKDNRNPDTTATDVLVKCNKYARSRLLGEELPSSVVIPRVEENEEEESEESEDKENVVRNSVRSQVRTPSGATAEDVRIHRLKESRKAYSLLERERMKERARAKEHRETAQKLRAEAEKQRAAIEQQVNEAIAKSKAESPVKQFPIEDRIQKTVQRNKKISTQSERLIKRLRGKIATMTGERPPSLCPCDADILRTGPEFCATNCTFSQNPKSFALALSSLMNCYQ